MAKKNYLNVWDYDFLPWKYPVNWTKNIGYFFRRYKWAYQRTTKGFCDRDVWDLDTYYTHLMKDSIDQLNKTNYGYPGTKEFPTPESWEAYLNEIVKKLTVACDEEMYNEYEEAWLKTWEGKDMFTGGRKNTPEEEETIKKYLDADARNCKIRDKNLFEALDMIVHVWHHLWD